MKLLIQKQTLLDAITIVQRAVMPKATMAVLEGIYIDASDKLTLVGNCFDLGISIDIDADIQERGSIVIQSKMFGEIIRKMPDSIISIEVAFGKVKIECMSTVFEVKGMDADSYPLPPDYTEESVISLKQMELKEMIRQTIFAVSQDENRRIMTGILVEKKDELLSLVSLDGFRMAVSRKKIENEESIRVVIPGKTMNELYKTLESVEDEVKIIKTGNMIVFKIQKCRIVSKTIDGEFMNYMGYIPTQFETSIIINCKEFEESLERASLMASDDKKYPIKMNIVADQIFVNSAAEMGSSKENVIIKNEGGDLLIGFNPKFLIDSLRVISDEKVRMSFNSQIGPAIIQPLVGDQYLFLVLPVRIKA